MVVVVVFDPRLSGRTYVRTIYFYRYKLAKRKIEGPNLPQTFLISEKLPSYHRYQSLQRAVAQKLGIVHWPASRESPLQCINVSLDSPYPLRPLLSQVLPR